MKRNERLRGKSTKTLARAMCTDHLPKIEGTKKLLTLVRRMGTLLEFKQELVVMYRFCGIRWSLVR